MNKRLIVSLIILPTLFTAGLMPGKNLQAGWQDVLKQAGEIVTGGASSGVLSEQQIGAGLKQALEIGVNKAIELLGREDGYLADAQVKIPMPERLQQVENLLRQFGQQKMADDFVLSMNRAAEKAVPQVTQVFLNAIGEMNWSDVQTILNGPDDAATRYFNQHTREQLTQLINPQVKQAMAQHQVTHTYQKMVGQVKQYDSFGLLNQFLDADVLQLDQYVTAKTLDGLFLKLAEEEKRIRDDPKARTTDLLKQVFGSLK